MEAMQFPARINALAWSPDCRYIAAACADGTVYIRDVEFPDEAPLQSLAGHVGEALSVTWSPDGKRIASGGADRRVQIWDAETGSRIGATLTFDDEISKVQWAPQGRRFLAVAGKRVWVMQEEAPRRVTFSRVSRAWPLRGQPPARLSRVALDHPYVVVDAEWSPDGEYIATTSSNLTIQIWDAVEDEWVLSLNEAMGVVRLKWAPDGLRVAVGTTGGSIYIYRPTGGQLMERHRVGDDPVKDLSWLSPTREAQPDGPAIAAIAGQRMKVIGESDTAISLDEPQVGPALAFSPDGRFLAAGGQNQAAIRIYPCSQ